MITNIKRQAAETLAGIIAAGIPALAPSPGVKQRVFTRASDDDKYEVYPSLYVLPGRGTLTPFPEGDERWGDEDSTLFEVGSYEGIFELRVAHTTPKQREDIEQAVLEQFFSQEHQDDDNVDRDDVTSSIIVASVHNVIVRGVQTEFAATVSISLDSEEWREEFAFGKRLFSFIECTAVWPAFRLVKGIPTIEQLVLESALAAEDEDLDGDPPFADSEDVQINDDGSIEPA